MKRRWLQTVLTVLAGMALAGGAGWIMFYLNVGQTLERVSYDLPFRFRKQLAAPEIRLVDIDETSSTELGQPRSGIWRRSVHAQLIRRLTRDGARAVFFDVIFDQPSEEPGVDDDLVAAMKENGHVFLGAALEQPKEVRSPGDVYMEQVKPPIVLLRRAAAGWGTIALTVDPGNGVRRIHTGTEQVPSATWRVAKHLGADLPDEAEERLRTRWVNYYGGPDSMAHVSYFRALQDDGVAPDFFKDKIVIVGGRNRLSKLGQTEDTFAVPWTLWLHTGMAGAEVHANVLLNLLHATWLTRGDVRTEGTFVVLVGIVIGGLLAKVRPQTALLVGVLFAGATFVGACWWLFHTNVWYNWLVPVAVQTPIAIAWSLGANYFLEVRRREHIRKAFSLYMSPHMADRIADEQFDLTPGGKIVEATVVFTDLEGFSALSEKLSNPAELAAVLIEYFSRTTGHVLDSDGTLIKYIGDSVFAAWGAPVADPEHAATAVLAAWRMHLSSEEVVQGHRLVTRVGINTGEVLAGNLGSKYRFDYTLIGDAVNFASRLEGLNKYLGTAVLLAESTVAKLGDRFTTRRLGEFIVVGKKLPVTIHELLGPAENRAALPWIETFAKALALFQSREFDAAGNLFRRTRDERNGADGPSQFYLDQIERLNKEGLPPDWNGAIEITAK